MIYTGKAVPTIMTPVYKSFMEFIREYNPMTFVVPQDKEEQTQLKKYKVEGFISGQMKGESRNDDNLINRDCLIIDLDDVLITAAELKKRMEKIFKEDSVSYVLYPSLRNGIKGVRYRLCVPLDREVTKEENFWLVKFMNERVLQGIIGEQDNSNATWSQLMLLPVITQFNKAEDIVIYEGTIKMPAQEFIDRAKDWDSFKKKKQSIKPATTQYSQSEGRTFLGSFLDSLVDGVSEGDRDRWLTSKVGTFFKQGMNKDNAYWLAVAVNNNFIDPPLSDAEVTKIVLSISKKEARRRGIQ